MSPRRPRFVKVRPPAADAVDTPWRLFLAVPLPEGVRQLVAEQISALEREGWPVRWVDPDAAHVTLHFLGETPPERAELLRIALPGAVARHAPFDLRTAAFGVFPTFQAPRVLWLGLHGPVHRLETLQRELGRTLAGLDLPVSDEGYHPHITLGRVRKGEEVKRQIRGIPEAIKRRFVDAVTGAAIAPPVHPVPVHEVLLMRSHLGKEGARYEAIGSYPLRGQGDAP